MEMFLPSMKMFGGGGVCGTDNVKRSCPKTLMMIMLMMNFILMMVMMINVKL